MNGYLEGQRKVSLRLNVRFISMPASAASLTVNSAHLKLKITAANTWYVTGKCQVSQALQIVCAGSKSKLSLASTKGCKYY